MKYIEVKFDGACRNIVGSSSKMGIGVAVFINGVYSDEHSAAIHVDPKKIRGTSNISEWEGCAEAMATGTLLKAVFPDHEIKIYSDSQLITNQFNDKFAINDAEFKRYYDIAKGWQKDAELPAVVWIRRDMNKEADKLSKEGLKLTSERVSIREELLEFFT